MAFKKRDVFDKSGTASFTLFNVCFFTLIVLFLQTEHSHAGNTKAFDLDIFELKKRTKTSSGRASLPTQKNNLQAKPDNDARLYTLKSKKNRLKNNAASNTSSTDTFSTDSIMQKKLILLNALPSPDSIPTPSPTTTVTLQPSIPPCELVKSILAVFFPPIPTAEALQGIPLAAPYAIRGNNVIAAIACGLAEAEELTFARLLESRGTRLINIIGNDSPETLIDKVTSTLGFPTQTQRSTPGDERLIYIFPESSKKETGFFISLANRTTTGNDSTSSPIAK
jgi:hypothetical protein